MQTTPLVSVIIPCFNGETYIRAAIESALSQTYGNVEIIIIDDGSSDKSIQVIEPFVHKGLVTLLSHPNNENRGVSFTRKLGIEAAKGDYVALLDADDVFEANKLEIQVELLERNRDCVLCHTAINTIYEAPYEGSFESWFNYSDQVLKYDLKTTEDYLTNNKICNSSVLIRKETIASIPFGSKQLFQFEDFLTWSLASQYGYFLYTPQRLTQYRYHSASASSKFLSNNLMNLYSHLEFYLSLHAKSCNRDMSRVCLESTYSTLNSLHDQYLIEDSRKCTVGSHPFDAPLNAENKISSLESEISILNKQLLESKTFSSQQELKLQALHDELDKCRDLQQQLLNSWSWRLTAPLRLFGRLRPGTKH